MLLNRILDILRTDAAYWVVQNSVGIVLPLLFGLVTDLRFPLACIGIVFYGITSQTLSPNSTIGGRMTGGLIFMGATLSGGLIGFSVVSLSWLARGSDMKALLEIAHELQLPSFSRYFEGNGDFFDAIDLVYKDIDLILEANSTAASTMYWVLLLLLFAILSLPWAWMRSTSDNSLTIGISLMGLSLTCTVSIFGLMMPITGQYAFWTLVYGGFLKAACVGMLGTILGGLVIYVKSSHDELRKGFARVLRDAGKTISHVSSCMLESMHAAQDCNMPFMDVPAAIVSHVELYDKSMRGVSIKSYLKLLQDLQDANGFLSSCKIEPPIPGISSQWGANVVVYTQVGEAIENVISQIGCVEAIYFSIKRGIHDASEEASKTGVKRESWLTPQDVPTGLRIIEILASICASIASVLQASSDALAHMPLFQQCSGNHITWRPKPKEFWFELYHRLFAIIDDGDMSLYLRKSGVSGIKEVLGNSEVNSMPFRLGGSSLVLVTAVESMIDYLIQLDQSIASALDITDRENFEAGDIHVLLKNSLMAESGSKRDQILISKPLDHERNWVLATKNSPIFKAIVLDVMLGTGSLGILVYLKGGVDMLKRIKNMVKIVCSSRNSKSQSHQQEGPKFRQVVFFMKYWSGLLLLMIIVVLVGWLAVSDTNSNLYNQKQTAEYLLKWMPFNAPIAVAICLSTTINSSIIKIFLRSTMIAFGGVLGFLTMLNGRLAQNPYYIFWMTVLVNAFFSLFSSIGSSARYSIFLVVYTYFSVVTCQYTGRCCQAGDVWEFAGRTISTIVGAAFALAFNWLVMPVYSSHIIFEGEGKLLNENMKTIEHSLEQGPGILSQKKPSNPPTESRFLNVEDDDGLLYLYQAISEKAASSFKTRLSIASEILQEKRTNSLEDWRFFVFDITLIPLPLACREAFVRITRMGLHINVCMHALKTGIYPYNGMSSNELMISIMMEDTEELLSTTQKLHLLIEDCLTQISLDENSKTEIKIWSLLELIIDIRSRLSIQFDSFIGRIGEGNTGVSDLKCLVFFQYLYASLDEVYHLGLELCKDESMKIRDTTYSFIFSIARKDDSLSFETS